MDQYVSKINKAVIIFMFYFEATQICDPIAKLSLINAKNASRMIANTNGILLQICRHTLHIFSWKILTTPMCGVEQLLRVVYDIKGH